MKIWKNRHIYNHKANNKFVSEQTQNTTTIFKQHLINIQIKRKTLSHSIPEASMRKMATYCLIHVSKKTKS